MNKELTVNRAGLNCDPFARFGDWHLIKLVLEAVDSVDAYVPASSQADFNPAQIVTLLTYCYARGIYSSEEIEARLPNDKAIAYICAGVKPDWHLLRRFLLCCELLEHSLSCGAILWAVPIGDAVVDRVKKGNGFVNPALFLPEVGKVDGRAQFPEFATLSPGDVEGRNKVFFRSLCVVTRYGYRRLQPVEVAQGVRLACFIVSAEKSGYLDT
jgi:hypothetical protein